MGKRGATVGVSMMAYESDASNGAKYKQWMEPAKKTRRNKLYAGKTKGQATRQSRRRQKNVS